MSFETQEIINYVIYLKNNNIPITFQQFVLDKENYIVEHTTIDDVADIIIIWSGRFGHAAQAANIKLGSNNNKQSTTSASSGLSGSNEASPSSSSSSSLPNSISNALTHRLQVKLILSFLIILRKPSFIKIRIIPFG
ncbi:hypothetical protein BDC45DRAFT_532394 [Circinella umbellata]|nr:hypothetical protein BDC45DRAFT_532394 [Circinella umbellata]